MSKTIRLEDEVYSDLDAIREKRETFSQAVWRIMRVYTTIKDVSDRLGPGHYLKERSKEDPEKHPPVRGLTETIFYNPERD